MMNHMKFVKKDANLLDSLPFIPIITKYHQSVCDFQFIYLYSKTFECLRINRDTFQCKFLSSEYKNEECK